MKRIGLIAMSGVRAHNEELTRLGLTLPGFVDRNKIIASLPSLGLLTLAGLTPDKFEIAYHEIADLPRSTGVPPAGSPGVPPGDGTRGETPLPPAAGDGCATVALDLPTDFDLVAISTFTAQFYETCDVADFYRARGIPVVMGGITVSSLREQAKQHCTSVVVGE